MSESIQAPSDSIQALVFDVGRVLVQWDPRHLFRALIPEVEARERFLAEVCPMAWNLELDRGRSWDEAIAERCAAFPEHATLIRAYRDRWEEMVPGAIPGTVRILEELHALGLPCYALTNFSVEMFERTLRRFPFFRCFDGIVVSGEEGLVKPDPCIYRRLTERYALDPARLLFIDDAEANVEAARACGWQAIHFLDAESLRAELLSRGVLSPAP